MPFSHHHAEFRRHNTYLTSTDPALVSVKALNAAFAKEWMYWANPLPDHDMQKMVDSSLNFGLYKTASKEQIGSARVITDYVTFAYLTDVYVLKEFQKAGLGSWLIGCVKEFVQSTPHSRRAMLITSGDGGEGYYGKALDMSKVEGKAVVMA